MGARFIDECAYIDNFMHEDQIGLIEEYTNIDHMKIVLDELQGGIRKCEKLFINPGSEGSSGSRSSQSESATTNILEEQHQEAMMEQRAFKGNESQFDSNTMKSIDTGGFSSIMKDSVMTSGSILGDTTSTLQTRTIIEASSPLMNV